MIRNDTKNDLFSTREVNDFTIITLQKNAKQILTAVYAKDNLTLDYRPLDCCPIFS